jgi:hypothetical protein
LGDHRAVAVVEVSNSSSKRDSNHAEVCDSYRAAGWTVLDLHAVGKGCPDILIAKRGFTCLVEIKAGKNKLEESQIEWHSRWNGVIFVVRDGVSGVKAAEIFLRSFEATIDGPTKSEP